MQAAVRAEYGSRQANTLANYRDGLLRLHNYRREMGLDSGPTQLSQALVSGFVAWHQRRYADATLDLSLRALKHFEEDSGIPAAHQISRSPATNDAVQAVRRVHARDGFKTASRKTGISIQTLHAVLGEVRRVAHLLGTPRAEATAVRDHALFTVAFVACLRRSEVVALRWGDISFITDGVRLCLRATKTHQRQRGPERHRTHLTIAASTSSGLDAGGALRQLHHQHHRSGTTRPGDPVFRNMTSAGAVTPLAPGGAAVAARLKYYVQRLQCDVTAEEVSGHSFRRGGINALKAALLSTGHAWADVLARLVAHGRWADVSGLQPYLDDAEWLTIRSSAIL